MTDFNDNTELGTTETGEGTPEESGNRNFLIVAGVLGGIMVLSVICIILFGTIYIPRKNSAAKTAAAEINAQNTAVAISVQQTDQAAKLPPTFTATHPPTKTSTPTRTQVVSKSTEKTPTEGVNSTATAAALYTQAAEKQKTATLLPVSTKLPQGGFADEVGLPGLFALAGVLLVVILIARRLRGG